MRLARGRAPSRRASASAADRLPDSASLELHLDKGAAEFRKFAELIELVSIEVYGRVSDAVVARLENKAKMLGSGTVTVHELYAGFAR